MKTLTPQKSSLTAPTPPRNALPIQTPDPVTVLFNGVRGWLAAIEIRDIAAAQAVCQVIPAFCPFAQEIKLFNRTVLAIPPLCKFNPFYGQLMALRFKALVYLEIHSTANRSDH